MTQQKIETKTLENNFKQGDILFGLNEPRNVVSKTLQAKGHTDTDADTINLTIVERVISETSSSDAQEGLNASHLKHYSFLFGYRDYLKKKPGKSLLSLTDNPELGAAHRRACKLWLINRDPGRTYNAHVITTGINWKRVCDKTLSGSGVTDSEMRAAYRDRIKKGPNPHIFFYNEKLELLEAPPWEKENIKQEFDNYESQRAIKGAQNSTI